jgi:septum formation protein
VHGTRPLVLASASPRRLALLRDAGIEPLVRASAVDEAERPDESPERRVARLATEKARAVARLLDHELPLAVVVGADTEVALDGRALGKPESAAAAGAMLRALAGRTHDVLTGVHVVRVDDGRSTTAVARTRVTFHAYDDAVIDEYVASGEPLDKAGAYGIQGLGARLVAAVDGSWSNVVGLPVEELDHWLARIGLERRELALSR